MANRWAGVTIDCVDVERVAGFWSVLLDRPQGPTRAGWVYLGGRFTGERHDYDEGVVVVMADPQEHEFCLTQYY